MPIFKKVRTAHSCGAAQVESGKHIFQKYELTNDRSVGHGGIVLKNNIFVALLDNLVTGRKICNWVLTQLTKLLILNRTEMENEAKVLSENKNTPLHKNIYFK